MAKKSHSFNVLLSEQEYASLDKLAHDTHCARSFIVRQSIRWRVDMQLDGTPICASGQRCFAPHMHHPPIQKQQHPNPE